MYKQLYIIIVFGCFFTICDGQTVKSVKPIPDLAVKIVSGNPKSFSKAAAYHILFDYKGLKIGEFGEEAAYIAYMKDDAERRKKGSGDGWETKWFGYRSSVFQPRFVELFNKTYGTKFSVDSVFRNQQYEMMLKTEVIEIGFNRNFEKSPTFINVLVTISRLDKTGEPLVILLENAIGNEVFSSYSEDYRRIEEAYAKCGKEVAKFMNKAIY